MSEESEGFVSLDGGALRLVYSENWKVGVWNGRAWIDVPTELVEVVDGPDGPMASIVLPLVRAENTTDDDARRDDRAVDDVVAGAEEPDAGLCSSAPSPAFDPGPDDAGEPRLEPVPYRIDEHTTDEDRWRDGLPTAECIGGCYVDRNGEVFHAEGCPAGLEGLGARDVAPPAGAPPPPGLDPPAPTRPLWGGRDPKGDLPEPPALSSPAAVDEICPPDPEVVHPPPFPPSASSWQRVRFFTITTEAGDVYTNNATTHDGTDEQAAAYLRQRWNMLAVGQPGKQAEKVELQPNGRVGEDRPDLQARVAPPAPVERPPEGESTGRATRFRWHRMTLQASMETVRPCTSLEELLGIVRTTFPYAELEELDVTHHGYDERTDWDIYLVSKGGQVIGLLDGEL